MKAYYTNKIKQIEEDHAQQVVRLQRDVDNSRNEIQALRSSLSFRLGSACVRYVRWTQGRSSSSAGRSILDPIRPVRWRTSPRRLRAAYRNATKSLPLLSIRHPIPREAEKTSARNEDIDVVWQSLRTRRRGAPRLLGDSERQVLTAFVEEQPHGGLDPDTDQVALIRSVASGPVERGLYPSRRDGRGRLLVDARTLQGGRFDGTARHAACVLASVLAHQEKWDGVSLLIDDLNPPVPNALVGSVEQVCFAKGRPDLFSGATAFLQLQPFHHLRHCAIVDELLATPGVRTATIWLDAIVGTYPDHFFRSPGPAFRYQWFLERLRHYDHVLALSNASRAEVLPLVSNPERVRVTGCRNPLRSFQHMAEARRDGTDSDARVTLFGNALPHKNIAAGLFAFAYAHSRFGERLQLDVVANLSDDQVRAAGVFLGALDASLPSAVTFHRRVSDVRVAGIFAKSRASIVPSFHEGFSLPVLESFDFGVPIVASDIPAHRELVGQDYPLAPPDDPAALGQNLLEALNRPTAWTARLENAPVRGCEERFEAAMLRFVDDFSSGSGQLIP